MASRSAEDEAVQREDERELRDAIHNLLPTQKVVIILSQILPLDEVAEVIKNTTGAVKSRLHRGRAALKNELGRNDKTQRKGAA
jgi:RNA polymerase sigma-70 factor (ECF subfamily)